MQTSVDLPREAYTSTSAADALDELTTTLFTRFDQLPDSLTTGWPSEHLIETISDRSQRLSNGERLGGTSPDTSPSRTFDAATARRRTGFTPTPDTPEW